MGLTLPSDLVITQQELSFDALQKFLPGSRLYYALGDCSDQAEYDSYFANSQCMKTAIADDYMMVPLGELAEKPGKAESKIDKLKTKNYLIPGRRASTVELTICGLSAKQKDYLESSAFQGQQLTIIITDKEVETIDPEVEDVNLVMFNGLSWVVEWSGEADGLWTVVISTEIQGDTEGRIYPANVPVYVEP